MKPSPSKAPTLSDLTLREVEVLHWLAEGKTNFETGIILGCKERTVKKHRHRIYKKLCVPNAMSASNFYRQAKFGACNGVGASFAAFRGAEERDQFATNGSVSAGGFPGGNLMR